MVIGERFAWAHLPKTGGTATAEMFRVFPNIVQFADPPDSVDAHVPFRDRAGQIEDKLLVLNFRRLPAWVLSRAQYVCHHGVYPDFKPIPHGSPQQLAESSFPDQRLALFTDDGGLQIDRWLRVETLAEDFLGFVCELHEVTEEERALVLKVGAVNALDYDRDVSHWFNPEQLETLYRSNPAWAAGG